MKTLYTFKVKKPSFEEQTTKNEQGVETTIKTKVDKDVEVYIKKPSHREIDEMDLFYSIQISDLQSQVIGNSLSLVLHDGGRQGKDGGHGGHVLFTLGLSRIGFVAIGQTRDQAIYAFGVYFLRELATVVVD